MKHVKQAVVIVAMIVALALMGEAQISVPHTFTTSVPVSQLNTNLSTIADGALKRNGGNITGNITADSGVTVDGVDISAALGGSGAGTFSTLDTSNTGAESLDVAGGAEFGTSNVELIGTDGRLKALSTTYVADLSGANLTGIPAQTALTNTWSSVTYSAGNFTGSGGMAWTVDSGDQLTYKYLVIGKMMTVIFYVANTDVTAPLAAELRLAIPGGYSAAVNVRSASLWYNDAPTEGAGLIVVGSGNTYIQLYKANSGASWTATATDNTTVAGTITFEIS